jgi:hypothetical protein
MRAWLLLGGTSLAALAFAACAPEQPSALQPLDASSSTAASTGAGGEGAGGAPVGPSAARVYFDDNVVPIFQGTCADCHANPVDEHGAPDFLGASPAAYYDAVTARPDFVACDVANSILLSKGADPGHAGPALTDGQHDKVATWLALEAEERFGGTCTAPSDAATSTSGGGDPPAPLTGEEAMAQLGECMTYDDWVDSGMPLVAKQKAKYLDNDVPCYSCHANGTGENWMPNPNDIDDVAEAFENMRWMYASFNLVRWTVNNEDGSFKDLVPSYRWRDKGQEGTNHPSYKLSADYVAAYEDWFDRTKQRWLDGKCGEGGGGP